MGCRMLQPRIFIHRQTACEQSIQHWQREWRFRNGQTHVQRENKQALAKQEAMSACMMKPSQQRTGQHVQICCRLLHALRVLWQCLKISVWVWGCLQKNLSRGYIALELIYMPFTDNTRNSHDLAKARAKQSMGATSLSKDTKGILVVHVVRGINLEVSMTR